MNFVDTAITLLHVTGKSMAVEDLCAIALERELLDKPGANPLRSMKTRMTVELKKGRKSRLLKNDDDAWRLRAGVVLPDGSEDVVAGLTRGKGKLAVPKVSSAVAAKGEKAKPTPKKAPAKTSTKKAEATSTKGSSRKTKALSDAPQEEPVAETPVVLSTEEKALVELYGESNGTMSAGELNEYRDKLTKDEDRPMLPEIRAERRPHRHRERSRKRRTRGDRERPERGERDSPVKRPRSEEGPRVQRDRSRGSRDIAGQPIPAVVVHAAVGEGLVRDAHSVLLALPPGQTMPVRQLTQTMVRQGQLEGSADTLWRMVKGVLLVSEQSRTTRGLSPLVRYHGKDLFSSGASPSRSAVDLAAIALSNAAEEYAAAVENEMQSRLAALALPMLERVIHIYLQTVGWTGIQWIRKVEASSYAIATPPGSVEATMIAVRSGPEKVDRRGVGELRAGVYAKDLTSGLLLSPCELSDDAEIELAKEGSHIGVMCSLDLIRELIAREVGISRRHIQLPQLDQRFFDAVLS